MPVIGAKVEHIFVDEQACCHGRGWLLGPDYEPREVQCNYRAVMRDEVNAPAVGCWRRANFAPRIRRCVAELPVQFARIHYRRKPFIVPRPKYDRTTHLHETCGRPASAILPPQ